MELSRRNFLKGSIAAGVVAAGSAALAGCAPASQGSQNAAATPTANTGAARETVCPGGWSWAAKPEPIAEDEIAETMDCDVCIVGLGAAGVPAFYYSALSGAKTIALQKGVSIEHNGANPAAWYGAHEAELGVTAPTLDDVLNRFACNVSDGAVNLDLVRNIIGRSGEVFDWLASAPAPQALFCTVSGGDHVRYQWYESESEFPEGNPVDAPGAFAGLHSFFLSLADLAEQEGAQILYETPAVQLITSDDGAVTGVIGQRGDGSYVQINASKGVILCTGDITNDEEMVSAYAYDCLGVPTNSTHTSNTGDGLKMGLWAGGKLAKFPTNEQMFINTVGGADDAPYKSLPVLMVNSEGHRFYNEQANATDISHAIARQTDACCWQIVDSAFLGKIESYGATPDNEKFEAYVQDGKVYKADSIAELASASGLPADALAETVDRYNALVGQGVDEDYGVAPEVIALNGIAQPPFYAMPRQVYVLGVSAGLVCDEYGQVVDGENQPIAGLYAAGGPQGNFFGHCYSPTAFPGSSLARCFTGGVLAVKHALGTYDEPVAL